MVVLPGDRTGPSPTLITAAVNMQDTLHCSAYNRCAVRLNQQGWLCVSIDIPGHGRDVRPNELVDSLSNWSARIANNENLVAEYTARVSRVLDFLVREKWTDADRIAFSGTSRGGFLALHAAAADPRITTVAAFAPVTKLSSLREFAALSEHRLAASLSVARFAKDLSSKKIWLAINTIDERVDSGEAWAAVQAIAREKLSTGCPAGSVEMHLMPRAVSDSNGHGLAESAYKIAADWIARQFAPGGSA